MAATVAAYNAALKRVYTQDRLEQQLFTDDEWLSSLEKTDRYNHGEVARVPLHTSRSGGYTALPVGGGTLNDAGNQGVNAADYTWANHHFQIAIQGDALDQTDSSAKSVANVLDTEVSGATDDIRFHLSRQMFQYGDGILVGTDTQGGAASATVELATTASATVTSGVNAVERGWVYVGLPVDIGTAAAEDSLVNGETILAVGSVSNPTITVTTTINTTAGTDFVSVKNSRDGATSHEANGMRRLTEDSGTVSFGGLTPNAEPRWTPANEDTTAQALTLSLLLQQDQKIHQQTGKKGDFVLTGLKQGRKFYELMQQQVRFNSDSSIDAGGQENASWKGKRIFEHPNCHDEDLYMGIRKHVFIVATEKPYWQNAKTGGNILDWIQGTDSYGAKLTYRCNLATNRRNAFAALKGLT
jgi:hypothetical protein